ncbi:MAG: hypothetical protein PHO94_01295 [Petrimonas sp.]|nr:hypothetical protein [Petrimonas sp.]
MKKLGYVLLMLVVLASCARSKEEQVLNHVKKTIGQEPTNKDIKFGNTLYEFNYSEKMMDDLLDDYRGLLNDIDQIVNAKHTTEKGVPVTDSVGKFVGNSEVSTWDTDKMTVYLELFEPTTETLPYKINLRVITKR